MLTFGFGLLDDFINSLITELHLPGGYQYCGPGTNLTARLQRGDPGINPLDAACKEHDIAYNEHEDLMERNRADIILATKALNRAQETSSMSERIAALTIIGAMTTKTVFDEEQTSKKENVSRKRLVRLYLKRLSQKLVAYIQIYKMLWMLLKLL